MASAADGKVVIDTQLNNKGFTKGISGLKSQMGGLTSVVKKLGGVIASAFAVKALVNFGKEAIELGSNVAEVQNVVDTAFGDMSYKVEVFSETAIQNFGMSRLAAKKTASTYMAMAKGMGIADETASNMAISLAGLTGDVASFYNISQEMADVKLKSVFTGETESLKELGVVMTQANLKAYALEKGITKDLAAMSQAELVALRYGYVMKSLALANGDFAKTSDSWANQTRILSMQWQEFMSIVGQALITVLTPAVKVLNQIVTSLINMANVVNSLVTELFGGQQQSAAAVTEEISGSVDEQKALTDATEDTAKAQKKLLAGFDEINTLGGGSEAKAESSADTSIDVPGINALATTVQEVENSGLPEFFEKLKNAVAPFRDSFLGAVGAIKQGVGVLSGVFSGIWGDLSTLGTPLQTWAEGPLVNIINSIISTVGGLFGGLTSLIASTLGSAWESHIYPALQSWVEPLSGMFSMIVSTIGSIFRTVIDLVSMVFVDLWNLAISPTVWEWAGGPLVDLFNTVVSTIGNVFSGLLDTVGKIFSDLWNIVIFPIIQQWIVDIVPALTEFTSQALATFNVLFDEVKAIFDRIWQEAIAPALTLIQGIWEDAWNSVLAVWDKYGAPIFEKIREAIRGCSDYLQNVWETIILPVWETIMAVVDKLWTEHLKPLWDNFLDFVAMLIEGALDIYNKFILPIANWFVDKFGGIISGTISDIIKRIGAFFGMVADVASCIIDSLKGVIDFIVGTFTGDWERAFEGIKNIFKGIVNGLITIVEYFCNYFVRAINKVISAANSLSFDVPDWVPFVGGKTWGLNIPKISEVRLPRLATGAVIPPNREFLAVLGDNKQETEVVSPLSTMKQALKEAMQESGGMGGNWTLTVKAGPGMARYLSYELENENTRKGGKLVVQK